jgi:hypothetical protein
MRDDERVKCGNVEVEKANENLEMKATAKCFEFYTLSFSHKKAVGRC